MDDNSQLHRDLGRMEQKLADSERRLAAVEGMVFDVHKIVTEARGGWRALLAIGAIAGAVGAGIIKIIAFLKGT